MSWPRYGRYKPSGVEWLGELPAHWEVKPLKRVVRVAGGMTPDRSNPSFWDGDIPWVTAKDMKVSRLRDSEDHVSVQALRQTGLRVIHPPAVLMVVRGMILAHTLPVAEIDAPLTVNQDMKVLRAVGGLDSSYLAWVLRGSSAYTLSIADESAHGTKALRSDALFDVPVPLPSVPEQRAIAAFIDRETARLDALIEKRRSMIALLQEKRAVLITHAVTRGLDPDVPLKDSGVAWLGQIPTHWDAVWLGSLASLQTGPFGSQLHAHEYVDDQVPVVNPAEIRSGAIVADGQCTLTEIRARTLSRHRVNKDDLLFARRGEMGRCGIVRADQEGWLCGTGCLRVRVRRELLLPSYLNQFFRLNGVREYLELVSVGSTMQNLNTTLLGRIPVLLPPMREQILICEWLLAAVSRVATAIENAERSIRLLTEYRASLITAAVTGQIDVRRTIAEPATEADKEPAL